MAAIDRLRLPAALAPAACWAEVATQVMRWLAQRQLPARDAVLLLPFTELLAPARAAIAAHDGWLPRIETRQTLAAALAPPRSRAEGGVCGDDALDRLLAAGLLRQHGGLGDWQRRDPAAFEQAVGDLVEAATLFVRGAALQSPGQRAAWWQRARSLVAAAAAGPSPRAALMLRVALEWAAMDADPTEDLLFALQPSAWIMLTAGDDDAAGQALLDDAAARGISGLWLQTDHDAEQPFNTPLATLPQVRTAPDTEAEAFATASAVIEAVAAGRSPVALIAEDRLLVRRVRALLERARLRIVDESGWTLSTTRAGAGVMALLRAVRPDAGQDAWLDWLKSDIGAAPCPELDALEAQWRRGAAPGGPDPRPATTWWEAQLARLRPLRMARRQPLASWLRSLALALTSAGPESTWTHDAAAREVWQTLRLDTASVRPDVDAWPLSLAEFTRWVDASLADARFRPAGADAQVIITPMARAMLRPFGQVVLPGADERHLGPPEPAPALISDALLRELGLPDAPGRGRRLARCFVQLLRHPEVVLLRRLADGDEHLGPSPWLSRLRLARRAQGLEPLPEQAAPIIVRRLAASPQRPPAPIAGDGLPEAVSASALESLRTCPYQFFARAVLKLQEAEELEAEHDKRDYGSLLHAALQQFHDTRVAGTAPDAEVRRLVGLAEAEAARQGLDAASLLPFRAGLPAFAERYLHWLTARDAEGWRYDAGEIDMRCQPPGLGGLQLRGRIDRLDRRDRAEAPQPEWQVIDYKTGNLAGLKQKVKQPLEDTQLAFYAAQVASRDGPLPTLSACYLALDDRQAVVAVTHPDVGRSAQALLAGVADEWQRLRDGAPLRPLGEGVACDYCAARGLCRRDHWAPDIAEGAHD
jgi:ATP-dependent helicase/nuclease subunit B